MFTCLLIYLFNSILRNIALQMYQEKDMWADALKLAQLHLPHRVVEINISYQEAQARSGKGFQITMI